MFFVDILSCFENLSTNSVGLAILSGPSVEQTFYHITSLIYYISYLYILLHIISFYNININRSYLFFWDKECSSIDVNLLKLSFSLTDELAFYNIRETKLLICATYA